MSYLRILNRGRLARGFIELIGLTTKRERLNDPRIIGFKGSGTKLAALAAVRLGVETIIASTDEGGPYLLRFDAVPYRVGEMTVRRLRYRYLVRQPDGTWQEQLADSSLTLDAFLDWDAAIGDDGNHLFKILREHLCNAYDEDESYSLTEVAQQELVADGYTAVYLQMNARLRALLESPARYFKFLAKARPQFSAPGIGAIFPKTESGKTRLFVNGVLVDCRAAASEASLFDYSLFNKSLLSEERLLKSQSSFRYGVARLFSVLTDTDVADKIAAQVVSGKAPFEAQALKQVDGRLLSMTPAARTVWFQAFHRATGKRLVLPSASEQVNVVLRLNPDLELVGWADYEMKRFLAGLGVPKADDLYPIGIRDRLQALRWRDLTAESRQRFMKAYLAFAAAFPDEADLPIGFFVSDDPRDNIMNGFAGEGEHIFREIWLRAQSPRELGPTEQLLRTLIHEARHCRVRLGDDRLEFFLAADGDLARLALALDSDKHRRTGIVPAPNFIPVKDGKPV